MEKIKRILEHWPLLYRVIRKIYIPLATRYIGFRAYLRRNRLSELWAAGCYDKGDKAIEQYREAINHPHRRFLIDRIAGFSPISSVLEIGCGTGANLYLLSKEFPSADIRGVDINPKAVQIGNEWFSGEGIGNVELSVGRAETLDKFPDKSFDVIFTDATLIYVSRDKIYEVIKEMVRIARKGLVFVELYDFRQKRDTQGLGVFVRGLWRRDYVALLKQFVPEEKIHIIRITKDIWPDRGWEENGALIEVTIP